MNFQFLKPFKKIENLIPLIILLLFILFIAVNIHPSGIIYAGRVLYEKTDYGFRPVYRTYRTSRVKVVKRTGNFLKVKMDLPDTSLWIPVQMVSMRDGIFGKFFIDIYSGHNPQTGSLFTPAYITKTYRIKSRGRYRFVTEKYNSTVLLTSLIILMAVGLSFKKQIIQNIITMAIFCFFLFYCIYASSIITKAL
ncbi:MAG: hypothetical protein KAR07_05760 [Spirochaetes bacterium]|nr:hypothetical protein [Spirochaetota bacterium]